MSGTFRGQDYGGSSIPPIEIGSFSAARPDKSDFIGSASGVFFVNTVFRAFAAAAVSADGEETQRGAAAAAAATAPDPGSAHSYLAADAPAQVDQDGDGSFPQAEVADERDTPGLRSYDVTAPGLGRPPAPAAAKTLIMVYFRDWHPFFPFLHGPTFFEEVDQFYQKRHDSNEVVDEPPNPRSKLCRAVTFQCIFNIASLGQDSVRLETECRIQSAPALTHLLGAISGTHDISALQALLAAELYLTSTMSLRAASTIHGALTRILYHSGFHRCPFRFVQLPRTMYDIRKRIFWCAYVLDRHLSQALGYPVAIRDDEVDVCIPGMVELHKPVKPREQTSPAQASPGDDVREHLPRDPSVLTTPGVEPGQRPNGGAGTTPGKISTQSPIRHHAGSPGTAGEYVLGYLVTYSRLLGASLDLFHKSIHKRVITRDQVVEITYRTHAWWNSLPLTLQDDLDGSPAGTNSQFSAFFAMLYHYLILLINRPFLSLPTHTVDFRSCLQSALSASRSIVTLRARRFEASPLVAWPGMLSATWMAGLVVAFAGLLELYPQEKTISDLHRCLATLDGMGNNWPSARHCHSALNTLLDKLRLRPQEQRSMSLGPVTMIVPDGAEHNRMSLGSFNSADRNAAAEQSSGNKRRRMEGNIGTYVVPQVHSEVEASCLPAGVHVPCLQDWQPVLEYTGPDFGFDADLFASHGEWNAAFVPNLDPASGQLFSNAGFDAYVQHFGDRLNF
ncbi:fungal-specific transcription factor [Coniochaeta sp. 2T2.1]|nr:fungal-specific transcription factor [Coniochaeta sp. 2T2.1]